MAIIDQYKSSKLGLINNNIAEPAKNSPAWGYVGHENSLDPALSRLHNEYSTIADPNIRISGFNKDFSKLKIPSNLDVLDPIAPKLTVAGVVSQTYNPSSGNRYKDKGPAEGRY